jgi:hypothetical protein
MISKYKEYINEGVRDKMTPKSKEDIDKALKDISPERLMKISVFDTYNLDGVKEAIKRGYDPSKDNNQFLKNITLNWHYDDNIVDICGGAKGIIEPNTYLVDNWFIGHCLDEEEDEQKVIMEFYKEVLKILLTDERVLKNLSAVEILGYRTILGIK